MKRSIRRFILLTLTGVTSSIAPATPPGSVPFGFFRAPPVSGLRLMAGMLGGFGNTDGNGSAARFYGLTGVAMDSAGNTFVVDNVNSTIRKITPAGAVSTFAGSSSAVGSADGAGSVATFNNPRAVVADASDNLFVADTLNHTIRKITPAGVVSTFAGSAGATGSTNATGTSARFNAPRGIAIDGSGVLYVADTGNHTIRKITAAGAVSTLAGLAGSTGTTNANGASARFNSPRALVVDGSGNVFVADTTNRLIRKITTSADVTTLAGTGANGSADGTGTAAAFRNPAGITADTSGNVYVADTGNHTIRQITSAAAVTTIAGTASTPGAGDGSPTAAKFNGLTHLTIDGAGKLIIADTNNNVVRALALSSTVTTVAGSAGLAGSIDATGAAAAFNTPNHLAVDGAGNVYVADNTNQTIRKISPAGAVTTLAGSPGLVGSTDGTGSTARFSYPVGVVVDGSGNVYVSDTNNSTIRKITAAGAVSTFAGSAGTTGSTDGTGTGARFNAPAGIAVDGSGNLFVADSGNSTIRKVTAAGVVSTFAGSAGTSGSSDGAGVGGARFNNPYAVAVDGSGNVFVADTSNATIRKITSGGAVTTFAGAAGSTGSVDGTGSAARFSNPNGLAVDAAGNLYVSDPNNYLIRKITAAGVVTTVVGTRLQIGTRLGPLPSALNMTYGVAVSATNLYLTNENSVLVTAKP